MSIISNFSDITAESSGQVPSIVEQSPNDDDGAVSVIDHYNPKDLVQSWMKVAPTTEDMTRSPPGVVNAPPYRPTKTFASKRVIYSIVALLVLVIVAMIMAIVISLAGDSDKNSPASGNAPSSEPPPLVFPPSSPPGSTSAPGSPTLSPTSLPPTSIAEVNLRNLLKSVSPDAGLALADSTSSQYLAFSWLAADPKLIEYSDKRKIQRYVLATLYFTTSGDQWEYNDGWLSDSHECEWQFGEAYDNPCGSNNDEIIDLGLAGNKLNGTLPSELALLSDSMFHLELQSNFIHGPLPSEMSLLTNLRLLDLSENDITGTVPNFGTMQEMTRLILQKNNMTGPIPEDLGGMENLKILRLGENRLAETIPTSIGLLSMLEELDLSNNVLEGSIPDLGSMTALEMLHLNDNNLKGSVPVGICQLSISKIAVDCEEVFCSCCGVTCIQSFLAAVSTDSGAALSDERSPQQMAFSWLLSDPNLSYYQPQQLLQRYVLATLYFSLDGEQQDENGFLDSSQHECSWVFHDALPIIDAVASTIESDELSAAQAIDGDMSTRWASDRYDPQWIQVDLGESHVLESIQIVWEDAYASEYRVEVSNDEIIWRDVFIENDGTGGTELVPLDNAIGRFVRIYGTERATRYGYSIWGIKVRGTLPIDSCDSDRNLIQIAFDGNSLSGMIPPEISLLSTIQILNLSDNKFYGPIPSQIGLLTSLKTLNFSFNFFTGTIPTELGQLSKLQYLRLSENFLSGMIPTEIGGVASLETAFLDENMLTGSVPARVCDLGLDDLRVDCAEVECSCCGSWC